MQQLTIEFFDQYCDEAWGFVSPELLVDGFDSFGFDMRQLRADLRRHRG